MIIIIYTIWVAAKSEFKEHAPWRVRGTGRLPMSGSKPRKTFWVSHRDRSKRLSSKES